MRMGKIVCTIGPACDSSGMIASLIKNGMDVARVNFSHGTASQHLEMFGNIKKARRDAGKNVAIMADLQGPKIRCRWFAKNPEGKDEVFLKKGDEFFITSDDVLGSKKGVGCTYKKLPKDVKPGDVLLLDDGLVRLKVKKADGNKIFTEVLSSGKLSSHKGINLPGVSVSSPALTKKDEEDLKWALEHGADMIAMSFVRKAQDLKSAKKIMEEKGIRLPIIVKMEKPEAIENMEEIVEASQGVMCARGDLAVELPFWQVPIINKKLVNTSRFFAKPVIMATDILSSMVENPFPTRAETSDCANAILDGCDATMTSNETATGSNPARVVEAMAKISQYASENGYGYIPAITVRGEEEEILSQALSLISKEEEVKAIAVVTETGAAAAAIAKFRPPIPTYAFTPLQKTYFQLSIYWGTFAIFDPRIAATLDAKELLYRIDGRLKAEGKANSGERILVGLVEGETPSRSKAIFDHIIS